MKALKTLETICNFEMKLEIIYSSGLKLPKIKKLKNPKLQKV